MAVDIVLAHEKRQCSKRRKASREAFVELHQAIDVVDVSCHYTSKDTILIEGPSCASHLCSRHIHIVRAWLITFLDFSSKR